MKKYSLLLAIVVSVICGAALPGMSEPTNATPAAITPVPATAPASATSDEIAALTKTIKSNIAQAGTLKIGTSGYQSQLDRILNDQANQSSDKAVAQLKQLSNALADQIKQRKAIVSLKPKYTPIIVEFYRENCPYCQKFESVLERCKQRYGNKITIQQLDTDDSSNLNYMHSLGSTMVPTCVFIDGFGRRSSAVKGCLSDAQLAGYVQGIVGR